MTNTYTVLSTAQQQQQQQRANEIGKHRRKNSTYRVWCAFGIDSYFTSSAAQRCILRSKQSKHTTSDYLLSIFEYRYRYRSTQQPHPYVHTVPFSLLFYGLLPRPHTLILPFFSFLFLFFLFFCFIFQTHEHTNTRTHTTTRPINDATNLPIITQ